MNSKTLVTRRGFVCGGVMSAMAFPFIARGALTADRPRLALIGMGKQARGLLHAFLGQDIVITAVCDCDKVRCEYGTNIVNEYYKSRPQLGIPENVCRAVSDFRHILNDKSIDMVCIATPDHWHAYMSLEAMRAGKDVYCEKPLTHTVEEARILMAASKKYGRILQTGAMQRSGYEFRTACEIVRNGCIGKVKFADANFGGPSRPHRDYENAANAASEGAPNPDVDFDMWCGGAPLVKYSDRLAPRGVHDFYPMFWRHDDYFGLGMCGDWGAHHLDIVQWGLGLDNGGPVKVIRSNEAPSKNPHNGGRRQTGMSFVCADGTVIRHNPYSGSPWGAVFYGTEGIVTVNRGTFAVWKGKGLNPDKELCKLISSGKFDGMKRIAHWRNVSKRATEEEKAGLEKINNRSLLDAVNKAAKEFALKKAPVKLYKANGHPADFVKCCKTREQPCSNATVGARSSILCNLCNISYVHDTGFDWNPVNNTFANGTGNAAWLTKNYRGDWAVKI